MPRNTQSPPCRILVRKQRCLIFIEKCYIRTHNTGVSACEMLSHLKREDFSSRSGRGLRRRTRAGQVGEEGGMKGIVAGIATLINAPPHHTCHAHCTTPLLPRTLQHIARATHNTRTKPQCATYTRRPETHLTECFKNLFHTFRKNVWKIITRCVLRRNTVLLKYKLYIVQIIVGCKRKSVYITKLHCWVRWGSNEAITRVIECLSTCRPQYIIILFINSLLAATVSNDQVW